jgi:hypothetical protein
VLFLQLLALDFLVENGEGFFLASVEQISFLGLGVLRLSIEQSFLCLNKFWDRLIVMIVGNEVVYVVVSSVLWCNGDGLTLLYV